MAQASSRLHHAASLKQSARHAEHAVFAEDAALLIERSGPDHISVTTQGDRDRVTGRADCVSARLTIDDAVRCRRALGLVIRQARKVAAL